MPFGGKISLWGHGRSTSNRPKSGYARPFGTILILADPHGHGEQVGCLVEDPPPLSDTAMAVRVQKHIFQADQLTHPTNPEVAACRVPVFGLRFVVSVFPVYRVNLASGFRIFRALFRYEGHERGRNVRMLFLVSLDFREGRSHSTHKLKWLQRESAHASGTIRKPWTCSTR